MDTTGARHERHRVSRPHTAGSHGCERNRHARRQHQHRPRIPAPKRNPVHRLIGTHTKPLAANPARVHPAHNGRLGSHHRRINGHRHDRQLHGGWARGLSRWLELPAMSHRIPGMTAPAPIQARMTGRSARPTPPGTSQCTGYRGGIKYPVGCVHFALDNFPPRRKKAVNGGCRGDA